MHHYPATYRLPRLVPNLLTQPVSTNLAKSLDAVFLDTKHLSVQRAGHFPPFIHHQPQRLDLSLVQPQIPEASPQGLCPRVHHPGLGNKLQNAVAQAVLGCSY